MLKWAVGQRNPTPGQISYYNSATSGEESPRSSCLAKPTDRLHIARRRSSRGATRKASIRPLRRIKQDKENQPCLTPESVQLRTRDSFKLDQMPIALRDVSNSPDPYAITPHRQNVKRRQSHPLNAITKHSSCQQSKSAPSSNSFDLINSYLQTKIQNKPIPHNLPQTDESVPSHDTPTLTARASNLNPSDTIDMRNPSSTLKSLPTMQIEYSPGPLTATQSLIALRQRLTTSLSSREGNKSLENPLYYTLNPPDKILKNGITLGCNEQSPTLEGLLEEKSIFDELSDKTKFLKKDNSKCESTLVSSLSQKLEWLRLNNSFKNDVNINVKIGEPGGLDLNDQGQIDTDICINETKGRDEPAVKKKKHCDMLKRQKCVVRRKIRRNDRNGAYGTEKAFSCDKVKPKILEKPQLMGLTLPLGIPSPITSEDSGLFSLGIEGIHPLSSSPIDFDEVGPLSDAVSPKCNHQGNESISTSLIANKCSPSSICSSMRKRLNEEDCESIASRDTWNEDLVPVSKTPRLAPGDKCKVEDNSSMTTFTGGNSSFLNGNCAEPSPLALVEKRSRSRRCLRFVSPSNSSCQGQNPRRPTSLSCPRLKDGRHGTGELELSVQSSENLITVHVGRGNDLHKSSGTGCNAYVKVALVPSSERTFFRTPVHRESTCPHFNENFNFKLQPEDLSKRILVSVWHRDRDNRKSEFLGCISLSVKNAIKKEISGTFRLLPQTTTGPKTSGQQRPQQSSSEYDSGSQNIMARRSGNTSVEDIIAIDEESQSSPERHCRFSNAKKKGNDDYLFLRHLELEPLEGEVGRVPLPEATAKGGRTPFTTTKKLTKQPGSGFGFSIAWIHPPRVERVESGQAADRAGIRPGDFVIFVGKYNIVTMSEEQILKIIKSYGSELTLEIYRKTYPSGAVDTSNMPSHATTSSATYNQPRSSTACSATTSMSLDYTKRRLRLPQVAFSNEAKTPEEKRKRTIYQLLQKEQNYAINLQFGVARFLMTLFDRRDFLNPTEHRTLFQNIEELSRISEDIVEQVVQEEGDSLGNFIGRTYLKKISILTTAYKKYCSGIKKADCLLAEKMRNTDFIRFCAEPAIPPRRPDITTFLHKPLEHYREMLQLLQTILNLTKPSEGDHTALSQVVHEIQTTFREVTAGFMEPDVEGRPLLSVQDLESRLVFTRCKPFVLSAPGRQWIFGGDLSRIEGRAIRPFWTLLFTDLMVFAKVSRDRVLFITEDPLSLLTVTQAFFNIRKRATEFRLLLNNNPSGTDSPANAMCGTDLMSRTPKKSAKFKSISFRAPTPELKAVWQNLIQRQIIYLNTARGSTPATSPLESPDPPTTLSVATPDSSSLRRQTPLPEGKATGPAERIHHHHLHLHHPEPKEMGVNPESTKQLNELIDHKCRQLGKTKASKGSAIHLAEWMKRQLGNAKEEDEDDHMHNEQEPEPEIWSQEELKKRANQLNVTGMLANRSESRCEEIDLSSERSVSRNTELSHQSISTSESQTTVKSYHPEKTVSVCRRCRKTCLNAEEKQDFDLEDDYDDNWSGPLSMVGMCAIFPPAKCALDPFTPTEPPVISVLPPTPDSKKKRSNWESEHRTVDNVNVIITERVGECRVPHDSTCPYSKYSTVKKLHTKVSELIDGDDSEETPEGSLLSDEPPYRSLSSSGLRRFGTLNSLEQVGSDEILDDDDKTEEDIPDSEKEEDEDKIIVRTYPPEVSHSIRGWTARAGCFVAEKMAFFERLSSPDNTKTVRKTTFFERVLDNAGDNHLDSPPEPGNTTSSSGKGEDEGETSGATSGEEVWGTPTSGGEFEEELAAETSALSFMESPHGSLIGTDDDTDQLMEELLISLPMLVARAPGLPLRRRLEPLMEEDDTESSSDPCSPKRERDTKKEQERGAVGSQQPTLETCQKFATSSTDRPLSSRREPSRPRIGTIDRALGIHSDDETDETADETVETPSFLHRIGLRRNREECTEKSSRLNSLSGCNKVEMPKQRPNVKKYLSRLASFEFFPAKGKSKQNSADESDLISKTTPQKRALKLGFFRGRKVESNYGNTNSAAYGGKPLFKYLFNKDTVDNIPGNVPSEYGPGRQNGGHLERRFWKQLKKRRNASATRPSRVTV